MKKVVLFLAVLLSVSVFADNEKVQLRQKVQELEQQVADLKTENDSLKKTTQDCNKLKTIIAYFADSTTIIFDENRIQSLDSVKLTQFPLDLQNKYAIIYKIADAHKKLSLVNVNIKLIESQKEEKEFSDEELVNYVGLEIKKDMHDIADQLDEIDKLDTSFLSKDQRQFVRQMSLDYDAIFNKYL